MAHPPMGNRSEPGIGPGSGVGRLPGGASSRSERAREIWIFGYGSLVWRPAFEHVERAPAVVRGWSRRFWQGSIDHRGVPEAPGRVVTLVRDATAVCHGMAFRVGAEHVEGVLASLDHRERGGYAREHVEVELHGPSRLGSETGARPRDSALTSPPANPSAIPPAPGTAAGGGVRVRALMYLATEANPDYLGPAGEEAIARQVAGAVGPSGANPEYVFRLADALRAQGAHDPHVFAVDRHLRRLVEPGG